MATVATRRIAPQRSPDEELVDRIAQQAGRDAGLAAALLGDYVAAALASGRSGRRLGSTDLAECRRQGELAAEDGVELPALLDLYLSATWRLWEAISESPPDTARSMASALFRASDDAAAALGRGYEAAQRRAIRHEESLRRELIDDLLAGHTGTDTNERIRRAGFNLAATHRVVVAETRRQLHDAGPVQAHAESQLLAGQRDGFVATKDGRLVCVLGTQRSSPSAVLTAVTTAAPGEWRVGLGTAHRGPAGVARSYGEATDALDLASSLGLRAAIIDFASLAPFRVLTQDVHLLRDNVNAVLGPLASARGGAAPLIETLEAYFDEGLSTTAAARRLHLSIRAVTYRLGRIAQLTGRSVRDPLDRFTLELAVRGSRLLHDAPFPVPANETGEDVRQRA